MKGIIDSDKRSLRISDFISAAEYYQGLWCGAIYSKPYEIVLAFSPKTSGSFKERPTQKLVDSVEETAMCEIAADYEVGIIEYHKLSLNDQIAFAKNYSVPMGVEREDPEGYYIRVTINTLKFID